MLSGLNGVMAARRITVQASRELLMMNKVAPTATDSRPGGARLALRFISGKYQGGEFPISEGQEIIVGRSSELDMVLVEEMVSRRHARIALEDDVITIEDLGSTNGTFVNGEKIQKSPLREGDRILIGTSILKVVTSADVAARRESLEATAARVSRQRGNRTADEAPRMSGNLEEIPLPDLLQLFGTSRKNGVLVLNSEGRHGRIYLSEGLIRFAEIEGHQEIAALKSVYRMLEWQRGMFELAPPDPRVFEHPVDVTPQEALMEGFRQQDELGAIRNKLPPFDRRLTLTLPLHAPLRDLNPAELDLLQLALNAPSLQSLLDHAPSTDLDAAQRVEGLIKRGYLSAAS
ncbi:MAG TPA: FHA domain-containing protein [Polyangiaceae bacterium]|nr:FHA domain-containing protein [Polyangiaceae bacterium]